MCLHDISKKKPPKTGFFWKVFFVSPESKRRLRFKYGSLFGSDVVNLDTWLRAENRPTIIGYESGFHGYATRAGAEREKAACYNRVIRCRYRSGRVMGKQYGYKVIVADEILVKTPKKW